MLVLQRRYRADYLLSQQVVKVAAAAAGTDTLVHGCNQRLQHYGHNPDKVVLRVDAAIAFNTVLRADILERVCRHSPPGARFFHAVYSG
jgi:hypothetical protein